MDRIEKTLSLGASLGRELVELARTLENRDVPEPAIIGALAAARHGYVRATGDLDLGTCVSPSTMSAFAGRLRHRGLDAHFEAPDAADPLGGVLTVRGEETLPIQFVNYVNPLGVTAQIGVDAIERAPTVDGYRVVNLDDLVLLKLYAGGLKSAADVEELLRRNPHVDRARLRAHAEAYDLGDALDRVLSA